MPVSYYGWLRANRPKQIPPSPRQWTPGEKQAVVEKKKLEPQLSHRQISGLLRTEGYWVSSSSCYRILQPLGWISPPTLREGPWEVPWYEPFRPNQIWGEDWTILSIDSTRHYLLTIIDYFSRYIVAWGVVKSVTRIEVQNLLVLAYLSEGIKPESPKPLLRADLGSPNMAHGPRRLIRDLELVFPLAAPLGRRTMVAKSPGIERPNKKRFTVVPRIRRPRSPGCLLAGISIITMKSDPIRPYGIILPAMCTAWGIRLGSWFITE